MINLFSTPSNKQKKLTSLFASHPLLPMASILRTAQSLNFSLELQSIDNGKSHTLNRLIEKLEASQNMALDIIAAQENLSKKVTLTESAELTDEKGTSEKTILTLVHPEPLVDALPINTIPFPLEKRRQTEAPLDTPQKKSLRLIQDSLTSNSPPTEKKPKLSLIQKVPKPLSNSSISKPSKTDLIKNTKPFAFDIKDFFEPKKSPFGKTPPLKKVIQVETTQLFNSALLPICKKIESQTIKNNLPTQRIKLSLNTVYQWTHLILKKGLNLNNKQHIALTQTTKTVPHFRRQSTKKTLPLKTIPFGIKGSFQQKKLPLKKVIQVETTQLFNSALLPICKKIESQTIKDNLPNQRIKLSLNTVYQWTHLILKKGLNLNNKQHIALTQTPQTAPHFRRQSTKKTLPLKTIPFGIKGSFQQKKLPLKKVIQVETTQLFNSALLPICKKIESQTIKDNLPTQRIKLSLNTVYQWTHFILNQGLKADFKHRITLNQPIPRLYAFKYQLRLRTKATDPTIGITLRQQISEKPIKPLSHSKRIILSNQAAKKGFHFKVADRLNNTPNNLIQNISLKQQTRLKESNLEKLFTPILSQADLQFIDYFSDLELEAPSAFNKSFVLPVSLEYDELPKEDTPLKSEPAIESEWIEAENIEFNIELAPETLPIKLVEAELVPTTQKGLYIGNLNTYQLFLTSEENVTLLIATNSFKTKVLKLFDTASFPPLMPKAQMGTTIKTGYNKLTTSITIGHWQGVISDSPTKGIKLETELNLQQLAV